MCEICVGRGGRKGGEDLLNLTSKSQKDEQGHLNLHI